ncbi:unnamed protein product [Ambrosiozyma monospora]|uniref:Unnamed protein product n=1 Tax=Ambrosiozyma monospora TaxID=43982 RepID=A0A9W7DGL6_AMBMO|nr:unnamed protein product [Ambrosiozyma monospora]
MSLRHLSKRYGANFDRLPHFSRKMFEQMSLDAQIPAFVPDVPEVPKKDQFKRPEQWKVQVGDKVLITKGKFKGTVTKVMGLHSSTNRLYLEQSETKKIVVPKQYWQPKQDSHVIDYPKTVSVHDIKVVGTLVEENGTERDIAADQLVFKGAYWDADYKKMMPYRRIKHHEHIIIPWPRPDPEEEDAFSTNQEVAEVRTYLPDSVLKTDAPRDIVKSLRDPLAKRAYKWDKKYLTKSDVKRMTPPEPLYTEEKKAMFAERAKIRESHPTEISEDVTEFIGSKVAAHLNAVEDPHFAQYINSVSPEVAKLRLEKREQEQRTRELAAKEAQERNRQKNIALKKYKQMKKKKNGNYVF